MASIDIAFGYADGLHPAAKGDKRWVCADLSRPDSQAPKAGQLFHLSAYGAIMVETGEDDDTIAIRKAFSVIPSAVTRSDSAIRRFITDAISYCHTCSTLLWLVNGKAYRAVVCTDGVEITSEPLYKGRVFSLEYGETASGIYARIINGPLPPTPKEKPKQKPKPIPAPEPEPVESSESSEISESSEPSAPAKPVKSKKALTAAVVVVLAAIVIFFCARSCGSKETPIAQPKAVAADAVTTATEPADTAEIVAKSPEQADTVAPKPTVRNEPAPTAKPERKPKAPAVPKASESASTDDDSQPATRAGHGSNYTIEPGEPED